MRPLLLAAVVLFALNTRADNVTVHVHESVTIDIDGATAAYANSVALGSGSTTATIASAFRCSLADCKCSLSIRAAGGLTSR